jgi:uncharacterized protein (TIGR00730 family)
MTKASRRKNGRLPAAVADPFHTLTAVSRPQAVCVYCGSGKGLNPAYAEAARILGTALAQAGIRLIYGGGGNGLMGETARAALAAGGRVTGIIPRSLMELEAPFNDVDELICVETLHERKMLMYQRSDAFVALPGGIGTLEELVEQLTWVQLGHHGKPVVIADIEGYWQPLLGLIDAMRAQTFIRPGLETRYSIVPRAEEILPEILRAFPALEGADQSLQP